MSEDLVKKIIRSKRRTLALQVAKDATLIVRAPLRLSEDFIEKFIRKNLPWIHKKQELARASAPLAPRQFREGEEFLYLGGRYRLVLAGGGMAPPLLLENSEFRLRPEYLENARGEFMAWYRARALEVLNQRVEFYSGTAGFKAGRIKINDARTRWGSCSPERNLNFSWRLIMAPAEVLDYVVVHELAHTVELNHSRKFWARVEKILPRYREARAWLRKHEHALEF